MTAIIPYGVAGHTLPVYASGLPLRSSASQHIIQKKHPLTLEDYKKPNAQETPASVRPTPLLVPSYSASEPLLVRPYKRRYRNGVNGGPTRHTEGTKCLRAGCRTDCYTRVSFRALPGEWMWYTGDDRGEYRLSGRLSALG